MFVVYINFLYNKNKYYYYTSSCITQYTISCMKEMFVVIIYSHYTSSRIIRNTLSCITEMFVVIIYSLI